MPNPSTTARRARLATRLIVLAAIAALVGAALAGSPASAKTRKSKTKTFQLKAHSTKTFDVAYPFALKYKGAKYSGKVTVSGPGKKNVKILSKGSALGGTVYRVKAKNSGGKSAKLKITATTVY